MAEPGNASNPLRVAIVGSGPAGFYAAEVLLSHPEIAIEVDMLDRLPTPYGLVRSGVAPDHPKIKNVIRRYEKTAGHEAFRFFGHVKVGSDISRRRSSRVPTTRWSGLTGRGPTGNSESPARTCRDPMPPRSSSPGTTATRTSPATTSTSPASGSS